jgi:hypothetical protein
MTVEELEGGVAVPSAPVLDGDDAPYDSGPPG